MPSAQRVPMELVSIPTDTAPLDGLYYEPDGGATSGAALLMHGNTMNFYTGALRFLPPALVKLGFACLAFNRRGHDILTTRASRFAEGGAYQLAREAIEDNRLAAQWLAQRGHPHPVVIGHSNGGMLAVPHVVAHPGTPAVVLLSGHGGGKNVMQRTSRGGLMAGNRIEELTTQARALVAAGRGRELMMMPGWWYVISAESFLDRLENTPDSLAAASQITCPMLFVRGDREPRDQYPGEEFQKRVAGPCTVEIVANCDHFYTGREDIVTTLVTTWLARTLGLQDPAR